MIHYTISFGLTQGQNNDSSELGDFHKILTKSVNEHGLNGLNQMWNMTVWAAYVKKHMKKEHT